MTYDGVAEQRKHRDRTLSDSGELRVIVTGAAGFIGSHLVDRLLGDGCTVVGLDNLDPWYDPAQKLANLAAASSNPLFDLQRIDLLTVSHEDLVDLLRGAPVLYHLAGRPGVQDSWGPGFEDSCGQNVLATQRLLEAAVDAEVGRVVLASSSSVYGDGAAEGTRAVAPISPYGVSKAAAEQLAAVYGRRDLPVVTMRYFTVFGPRQRPDMAFHRLLGACLDGPPFPKRGTGAQRREFTYVADVVAATTAAAMAPLGEVAGKTFDIGGGCITSLNEVIDIMSSLTGRQPMVELQPGQPGDPALTGADLGPALETLGWKPVTGLAAGLDHQWAWQQNQAGQRALTGDSPGSRLRSLSEIVVDAAAG